MTLAMPDSIYPPQLPPGYPAYLAYVDGARSKDADQVRALFPGARILTLTVLGAAAVADGCDCEAGDLGPNTAAAWLKHRLLAGQQRPVLYASRDTVPSVLAILAGLGTGRAGIRVLSAHYAGPHVCSPAACGATFTADGTQWTDSYKTPAGNVVDMSLLNDGFFGVTPPATANWTEKMMQELPVVKQGQTGNAVRTVQGLCGARSHATAIDGVFGPLTTAAVKAIQTNAKIVVDGIVGPQTWPALLGL